MADWYRDYALGPDAYSDDEYLEWVQDQGIYVDAAGNVVGYDVDYGTDDHHVIQYLED